jgi:hypothetical protein
LPYTSKYNPIKHRLFPHITRAGQGVIFTSLELVKSLVEKTQTKTGLSVAVTILNTILRTLFKEGCDAYGIATLTQYSREVKKVSAI